MKRKGGKGFFDSLKYITKNTFTRPIEYIKEIVNPADKLNNISTRTLNEYGNIPIKIVSVYRRPLHFFLTTALNLLLRFSYQEILDKYGYDKLFHLYLIVKLENGKNIIMEKNSVINIAPIDNIANDEHFDINVENRNITMNLMIKNTYEMMGNNMYLYNAFNNNCQVFVANLLQSVDLLHGNAKELILQNMDGIKKDWGEKLHTDASDFSEKITNPGGMISRLIGESEKITKKYKVLICDNDNVKFELFSNGKQTYKEIIKSLSVLAKNKQIKYFKITKV